MATDWFAVIMAGGAGTRFWPRSRRRDPKQTLPFLDGQSLLQRTVARLRPAVAPEDFLIVTGADQLKLTRQQLPFLPDTAFLAEPLGRNTAPCVGLAATVLAKRRADKPMVVLAADHFVADEAQWLEVFQRGAAAARHAGRLVLFGVQPTRPHTGYGYVEFGDVIETIDGQELHQVRGFREKPSAETAKQYLAAGNYYWNAGCFAWRPDTILAEFERHMPNLKTLLDDIGKAKDFDAALEAHYHLAPNVSVDCGIMEKSQAITGLTLDVGWNDVGAWPALFDVLPHDEAGNLHFGEQHLVLDCENSLFWGEDQLIAAVGVSDLIVVQAKGVVLVCPRSEGQRVKELVARLKDDNKLDYL